VGDWAEQVSGACTQWPVAYGSDHSCVGGNGSTLTPVALARGGYYGFTGGVLAGVHAVIATSSPIAGAQGIGFRCGR
jgi:hypothetical protein